MMNSLIRWAVFVVILLIFGFFSCVSAQKIAIVYSQNPFHSHNPSLEYFAAKEVKRYLYLTQRPKEIVIMKEPNDFLTLNSYSKIVVVATKNSPFLNQYLPNDSVLLKEISSLVGDEHLVVTTNLQSVGQNAVLCVGATPVATLYAAYLFVQQLGVRFSLHNDIIPSHTSRSFPSHFHLRASPKFEIRGIQPFHDFPEGPDWWGEQEYKAHFTQLAKLRMNFIGLHTYPLYEPTVWVGLLSDFNANGTVLKSYPTSYQNTLRGDWGYEAKNTSQYYYGNWALFPRDCYGVENLKDYCPWPTSPQANNAVFNNIGELLNSSFTYARALGIKTCVGTEIPMTKPPNPPHSKEDYYKGIFSRITSAYPIDYYWLWTPEEWEWNRVNLTDPVVAHAVNDLLAAYRARIEVNGNFELATCGWVLGPLGDRAYFDKVLPSLYTLSAIDMNVGWSPVDPAFGQVVRHKKWVIPWMEDDPGLTAPQLWVNRTLLHGLDAIKYNASGLLGIHWRTVGISPQIGALAYFPWNTQLTSHEFWLDFATAWFGPEIASDAVVILDSIDSFKMPRPVEWKNGPGSFVPITEPWDIVKNQYSFVDKWLALRPKVKGLANLERFDYWANTFQYMRALAKMECTWGVYNANMKKVLQEHDVKKRQQLARQLALPVRIQLVQEWSVMMTFLQQTIYSTGELGTIMNVEQHNMPSVLTLPGIQLANVLAGNSTPPSYIGCYIDEQNRDLNGPSISDKNMTPDLCQLFCVGFEYFGVQYGSFCFCGNSYGRYGKAPENECNMPCSGDPNIKCGGTWRNSVYRMNQNAINELPIEAQPIRSYLGSTRLIVPTIRTAIRKSEPFIQTVMVLSVYPPSIPPTLHLRPMGSNQEFKAFEMQKISHGREVWTVQIPQTYTENDFEYFIDVTVNKVDYRVFPVTAPTQCQTVTVW